MDQTPFFEQQGVHVQEISSFQLHLFFWGNGLFPKFAVNHHLQIQTRGAKAWLYSSMVQAKTKKDMFIYYTTILIKRYYTTIIIIVKDKMTMN